MLNHVHPIYAALVGRSSNGVVYQAPAIRADPAISSIHIPPPRPGYGAVSEGL